MTSASLNKLMIAAVLNSFGSTTGSASIPATANARFL